MRKATKAFKYGVSLHPKVRPITMKEPLYAQVPDEPFWFDQQTRLHNIYHDGEEEKRINKSPRRET